MLPEALATSLQSRPVLRSHANAATLPEAMARLGNVSVVSSVVTPASTPCGFRTSTAAVLCLDADGALGADDELALLSRLGRATRLEVGSLRARNIVMKVATDAGRAVPVDPVVTAFADCSGACDARIVVGTAP